MNIRKSLEKYEPKSTHSLLPIIWYKADGSNVWDIEGNKYIDFTSTICVTNTGHSNTAIVKALREHLDKSLLHAYIFPHEYRADLLNRLIEITPNFCEKAFLLSTGGEATECAVKLIRIAGMKKSLCKSTIVSFRGSMHGKSMLGEQLRGQTKHNQWAFDRNTNIKYLDFPKKDSKFHSSDINIEAKKYIAGVIIETYQGWSARFYPKKYIQDLVKWAKKNDILVCFDEVQGGLGRTGKLFNYMHYEVEPDLMCIGKGFGGGLPMSAVLGKSELLDLATDLSSTHTGNPLSCAGALANLNELIREELIKHSKEKGHVLHRCLEVMKDSFSDHILEHNGEGLLGGLVTDTKDFATNVCKEALKEGLILIYTGTNSIKIAPPLNIPHEDLSRGINILYNSIKKLSI